MQFHQDPAFDAQLKRTMGYIAQGGAELSECFSVAQKIKSRDYEGWYEAWTQLANALKHAASQEMEQQSFNSAGEKLLRASNYYRTAYFFLEENPEDRRILECLNFSKDSFKSALELLKIKHISLEIPFEDSILPGYLYLAHDPKSMLLIDTGGGDSTLEEIYLFSGAPALKRGYHCLAFEGPGQGSVLRMQKKPFRHDWEVVIRAVIDYIKSNYPEIASKIALRGDSFGGYLAARAAVYEKRIDACILNPGILNPMSSLQKLNSKWKRSLLFFLFPSLKFKICSRYMRFSAQSFPEMWKRCESFRLAGEAKKITCPVLVIDNEEEHITKGEALKLYEQLECPKKYILFQKEQCSGGHCQPLAQLTTQEMIFDWLDSVLF